MTTQEKQTTIINIYAGPGAGKSTTTAQVFAMMKQAGLSVEMRTEYVKDWAWRGRQVGVWDDIYLIAKQLQRESVCYGKVDYIVTDSPLGLAHVYSRMYPATHEGANAQLMLSLVRDIERRQDAAGIRRVNCLLKRNKPYVNAGRYEDEAAARRVDSICEEFLRMNGSRANGGDFHYVTYASDVLRAAGVVLP